MREDNYKKQAKVITVESLRGDFFGGKPLGELLKLPPKDSKEKADESLVRLIVGGTDKMMQKHAKKITYTQLRNVLANVKKKEFEEDYTGLLRAIPKLAYMEGRQQKEKGGEAIIAFIRELAFEVKSNNEYKAFEEIINTLVAYHKVHG